MRKAEPMNMTGAGSNTPLATAPLVRTCRNCEAVLHGRYCSACGQSSGDLHRPTLHLLREGVEGFTHLDGRLARTLPLLLFHPGRLARDQLEGRRARHVPPVRLFLISLLLFMLSLESAMGNLRHDHGMTITLRQGSTVKVIRATPGQMADVLTGTKTPEQIAQGDAGTGRPADDPAAARENPITDLRSWLRQHTQRALANPGYFELVVFTWAHRLAILLLPIFAIQLALLYAWRTEFYLHDHLVVSVQFLSFAFLLTGLAWLPLGPLHNTAIAVATLWVPVNLYQLLRSAYGSSVAGALARTAWLWLSTQIVFIVLVLGLLLLGLAQL